MKVEREIARRRRVFAAKQAAAWLQNAVSKWRPARRRPNFASLSYRYLARQIEADLPFTSVGRTILMSSPAPAELSNEAMLMFSYFMRDELGCRILLVDGTFRDSGIGATLGYAEAPGFIDLLYDEHLRVKDVVVSTTRRDISLIAAGRLRRSANEGRAIAPSRIAEVFADGCGAYDYVLVQQKSIFADTRYLMVAARADMTLMFVEEGGTLVEEMERSSAVFQDHDIANVRLVLMTK